jgi:hypothetical protein
VRGSYRLYEIPVVRFFATMMGPTSLEQAEEMTLTRGLLQQRQALRDIQYSGNAAKEPAMANMSCWKVHDRSAITYILDLLLVVLFSCGAPTLAATPKQRPTLHILAGLSLPERLATAIQATDYACTIHQQRQDQRQLLLGYGIFSGQSALRDLDSEALALLGYLQESDLSLPINFDECTSSLSKTAVALLLLGRHHPLTDAAHEVLLGVTVANVGNAEYSATHPGETPWSDKHPLTDCDDMLHSVIHRLCEGSATGEGGLAGWENAAYWAAGGPKLQYAKDDGSSITQQHPVRAALAMAAMKHAPFCMKAGVVCSSPTRQHRIIARGGTHRTVIVPQGWWDPFCFIDLIQMSCKEVLVKDFQDELDWLQLLELHLLLRFEFQQRYGLQAAKCDFDEVNAKSLLVWATTTKQHF